MLLKANHSFVEVQATRQLESDLKWLLPTSLKPLSMVQLGLLMEVPGLKFLALDKDRIAEAASSSILVGVMEEETGEDYEVTLFCMDDPKEIKLLIDVLDSEVDWSLPHKFGGVPPHLLSPVYALAEKHNGKEGKRPLEHVYLVECAEELKRPEFKAGGREEVEVRPLSEDHIPLVTSRWKFANAKTDWMLKLMFTEGFCFGAFPKDAEDPVAWICTMRYGGVGILYTLEEHRRRGHAQRCIYAISKHLLQKGITPYVYIEDFNQESARLFSSMGYKNSHQSNWIVFHPSATD